MKNHSPAMQLKSAMCFCKPFPVFCIILPPDSSRVSPLPRSDHLHLTNRRELSVKIFPAAEGFCGCSAVAVQPPVVQSSGGARLGINYLEPTNN